MRFQERKAQMFKFTSLKRTEQQEDKTSIHLGQLTKWGKSSLTGPWPCSTFHIMRKGIAMALSRKEKLIGKIYEKGNFLEDPGIGRTYHKLLLSILEHEGKNSPTRREKIKNKLIRRSFSKLEKKNSHYG